MKIAAYLEQFDGVPSDEGGWPASFDDHSAGAIRGSKDDGDLGVVPKRSR